MFSKGSVPLWENQSAIDGAREIELNQKLKKALETEESKGIDRYTFMQMCKTYQPPHGQIVSASSGESSCSETEATEEVQESEFKEEEPEEVFEEERSKSRNRLEEERKKKEAELQSEIEEIKEESNEESDSTHEESSVPNEPIVDEPTPQFRTGFNRPKFDLTPNTSHHKN